ncbi:efflux RND transporter periplasmic adaptor subunit [Maritimibacter sp. DP1N21-5]|uniref:efflux RND transporter periplasmic adaptor subunit n=1 Tax=Maritimibacter sp. DP1N21-5 TaxID=2836867 RepID=UPI0021020E94|nr:efflux RND transporter periplasmic adaptor subunit [Maritimibacter sp. DP1N21-5]
MENPKPDWAMNKREKARAEMIARGETPKKRRWPWIVLAVLIVGGVGGGIYARQAGLLPEPPAEPVVAEPAREALTQLAPYEITTIAPTTLTETLRVTGSLAPTRDVHLSAEVSARLTDVSVRAGDAVEEGQLLASFDVDSLQNQLDQARSTADATRVQVAQAQTDFNRTQTLVERQLAAPTALEQAQSGLEQLQATLAAQETAVANAQTALDRAQVTAPFAGVVSERSVSTGEFVAAGSPLFTVVDLTSLEVEATAPVSLSPKIAAGQPVELTVEGFGDRVFEGRVDRINPVAIEGSRALPVYVSLDNAEGDLRGGMFASGRILLERKDDVLSVPASALREDAEGAFVLVIEDNVLTRRDVETAREWEGGAAFEVTAGLEPGDVVLSEALPELRAGTKITLVEN